MQFKTGNNNFIQTLLITLVATVLVPSFSFGANEKNPDSWKVEYDLYDRLTTEQKTRADQLCAAETGLVASKQDLVACFMLAKKATNMHMEILPRLCPQWSNARNPRGGELVSLAACANQMVRADLQVDIYHDHPSGENCSPANSFEAAVEELHEEMREDVTIFGSDDRQLADKNNKFNAAAGKLKCNIGNTGLTKRTTAFLVKALNGPNTQDVIWSPEHSFKNHKTGQVYHNCKYYPGSGTGKYIRVLDNPILGGYFESGKNNNGNKDRALDSAVAKLASPVPTSTARAIEVSAKEIDLSDYSEFRLVAYNDNDRVISESVDNCVAYSPSNGDIIKNSNFILNSCDANGGGSGGLLIGKSKETGEEEPLGMYLGGINTFDISETDKLEGTSFDRVNNVNIAIKIQQSTVDAIKQLSY